MTRVIVDELLKTRLHNLKEPLELCDPEGHVLARLTPSVSSSDFDPSQYERVEPPPLTPEEVAQILSEPTFSTSEVIAYLESL